MAEKISDTTGRKPRADAERNRALLLEAAKIAFASRGKSASLDEIARAAGVGIGTLYRHFPTRDALIGAVYARESDQLSWAADLLAQKLEPVEALRQWMILFVDYLAAKHGMAEVLNSVEGGASALYAASGTQVKDAIAMLAERARDAGAIRLEMEPLDLLRAIAGVANVGPDVDWTPAAKALVNVLIAGIRTG